MDLSSNVTQAAQASGQGSRIAPEICHLGCRALSWVKTPVFWVVAPVVCVGSCVICCCLHKRKATKVNTPQQIVPRPTPTQKEKSESSSSRPTPHSSSRGPREKGEPGEPRQRYKAGTRPSEASVSSSSQESGPSTPRIASNVVIFSEILDFYKRESVTGPEVVKNAITNLSASDQACLKRFFLGTESHGGTNVEVELSFGQRAVIDFSRQTGKTYKITKCIIGPSPQAQASPVATDPSPPPLQPQHTLFPSSAEILSGTNRLVNEANLNTPGYRNALSAILNSVASSPYDDTPGQNENTEQLHGEHNGIWTKRITGTHRLAYQIGRTSDGQPAIQIISVWGHYPPTKK